MDACPSGVRAFRSAPGPCQLWLSSAFAMLAVLAYGVAPHCEVDGQFSESRAAQGCWGGSVKSQGSSLLSFCATILCV